MDSVSVKWYLPTGHCSHLCFSDTGSDFLSKLTEAEHQSSSQMKTIRKTSCRFVSAQRDGAAEPERSKVCISETVALRQQRCCHDNATGKVGQRAPATPLLAWQQDRSIKPQQYNDSHTLSHKQTFLCNREVKKRRVCVILFIYHLLGALATCRIHGSRRGGGVSMHVCVGVCGKAETDYCFYSKMDILNLKL